MKCNECSKINNEMCKGVGGEPIELCIPCYGRLTRMLFKIQDDKIKALEGEEAFEKACGNCSHWEAPNKHYLLSECKTILKRIDLPYSENFSCCKLTQTFIVKNMILRKGLNMNSCNTCNSYIPENTYNWGKCKKKLDHLANTNRTHLTELAETEANWYCKSFENNEKKTQNNMEKT